MWSAISRVLGKKPPGVPARGEALAAPVSINRPSKGAPEDAAALIFTPDERFRDDPVFLSRAQWRLQELIYDGTEPGNAEETATRDLYLKMGLSPTRPRAYHLSTGFAPTVPFYIADVAIPASLHAAGLNFGDHDRLFRVRYDLSDTHPVAELIPELPAPAAIARRRLEAMLARGARFVRAELVQANYTLYQPAANSAACMVMFSFDYTVTAEEMRAWAERLHPLKYNESVDPVVREAVRPLEASDRSWYYHRRFTIPSGFTGGRVVYLADLWVHRPFIDGRFPSRSEIGNVPRRVPVLAEKKDTGWAGIELIPFTEVAEWQHRATQRPD